MTVNRRTLIKTSALGALGAWSFGCESEQVLAGGASPFRHGVASGDPNPDSVILWTRLTVSEGPDRLTGSWELLDSPNASVATRSGSFETDAERDYTVKVEAAGLEPRTTYYYRFTAMGFTSPTGRTRTLPALDTARLRLAVFSCANYAAGYFHAYRAAAARADIDAVLHLGDYIYEYGNEEYGSLRTYDPPHEVISLSDYRRRYAHYRSDPDLMALHRQFPMLAVWDDHEVANNAWKSGAENHDSSEGSYLDRKRAAQRAYFEWLPVRESEGFRLQRSFRFGDLVHLVLADTRHWGRDEPISDVTDPDFASTERSILGEDQTAWLTQELSSATARWRILAQQVMFSQLDLGVLNTDAWDGYPASRERVLNLLEQDAIGNLVILSGDIHMSWAIDVVPESVVDYNAETGVGSVAVELVVPSVTSPSLERDAAEMVAEVALQAQKVRLAQLWRRGYVVLDIDHERLQAEWYLFDRVDGASDEEFYRALHVRAGESFLRESDGPSLPVGDAPELAPTDASPSRSPLL